MNLQKIYDLKVKTLKNRWHEPRYMAIVKATKFLLEKFKREDYIINQGDSNIHLRNTPYAGA